MRPFCASVVKPERVDEQQLGALEVDQLLRRYHFGPTLFYFSVVRMSLVPPQRTGNPILHEKLAGGHCLTQMR